jgi:outer membrane immunogenic protein
MKKFAIAAAALVVGTVSASAADLAARYTKAPAPIAAVYNWTGFYIGAHAGWGWNEGDTFTNFLPSPAAFGAAPFGVNHRQNGGMAGGQIGFNYQVNNLVWGVEADISWVDWDRAYTVGPLNFFAGGAPIPGSFQSAATDMNWFGTVRGRLGFAVNNWMFYGTGGLAYADVRHTVTTSFAATGGGVFTGTSDDTRFGWTAGAGFEWGFVPNWSLKAEYLYYDLGDTTVTGLSPVFSPFFTTSTSFENKGHIARVGINYRFGGAGAVVAKY